MRTALVGTLPRKRSVVDRRSRALPVTVAEKVAEMHPSAASQPVSGQNPSWLSVAGGVLWLGIGDWNGNTGPVDLAGFRMDTWEPIAPVKQSATEQFSPVREINGNLYAAWVDPKTYYGNSALVTNEGGEWHEVDLGHMVHTFDVATSDGTDLLVCGSRLVWDENGNPNNAEAVVKRRAAPGEPWVDVFTHDFGPDEGLGADGMWGNNGDARFYSLVPLLGGGLLFGLWNHPERIAFVFRDREVTNVTAPPLFVLPYNSPVCDDGQVVWANGQPYDRYTGEHISSHPFSLSIGSSLSQVVSEDLPAFFSYNTPLPSEATKVVLHRPGVDRKRRPALVPFVEFPLSYNSVEDLAQSSIIHDGYLYVASRVDGSIYRYELPQE